MIRKQSEMKQEVRSAMRGGKGAVTITHMFGKDEFGANVRLCSKLTIPPGAGIGSHRHEGEDEVYIIEQGQGVLDDGSNRSRVEAGDAILTGNGDSHAIENNGDTDLVITAIIACYP